jgi:hypothetical protein
MRNFATTVGRDFEDSNPFKMRLGSTWEEKSPQISPNQHQRGNS